MDERRSFQRLKLTRPILGTVNGEGALILDIGISGAFVEHYGRSEAGDRLRLVFRWMGKEAVFIGEVVRSSVVRMASEGTLVSHTAIKFVGWDAPSYPLLQEMMATLVGQLLATHRANAAGKVAPLGSPIVTGMGEAGRSRSHGFVSFRFRRGKWMKSASATSAQPDDGFTVARAEDDEDLEVLCREYEFGDDEMRRMIRLVAELSARSTG